MKLHSVSKITIALWAGLLFFVEAVMLLAASCMAPARTLAVWLPAFSAALSSPLSALCWTRYSAGALGFGLLCVGLFALYYQTENAKRRAGEEHGSALWGTPRGISQKYADHKRPERNIILGKETRLGFDTRKHRRNLNVLVVGGSGAGKTRFFVKPNVMQANCSYLITDPKGELLRDVGPLFESLGIEITVLNLVDKRSSDGYNPFVYIKKDSDVLTLLQNLIKSTTPKNSSNNDPFWEKAEIALLAALILYLKHEAPAAEQNFAMVLYMIARCALSEQDESYESPVDRLFWDLARQNPEHIALKQYQVFKQAEGKTAQSILVSAAVRLAAFGLADVAALTDHDDMDFAGLGRKQRAIFAVIPDNDTSLNYLVGMLYAQAFQALYYEADHAEGGRLPVHVRAVMDEFANVALPDDFERILSTCRSREISINIIIQNMAQIKALFEKSWENLPGNCDTLMFLGGNEQSTHEYISKLLGRSTIDTRTRGITRGRSGSASTNYQNAGRELLMPDEVRKMDDQNALIFIRGEKPIMDEKYDLMRHPNIKHTADGGAAPYKRAPAARYEDDLAIRGFSMPEELAALDLATMDKTRLALVLERLVRKNALIGEFALSDGQAEEEKEEAAFDAASVFSQAPPNKRQRAVRAVAAIAGAHPDGFRGSKKEILEEYKLLTGESYDEWEGVFSKAVKSDLSIQELAGWGARIEVIDLHASGAIYAITQQEKGAYDSVYF
jgi:type IV secretion system protein VirD4